MNPEKRRAREKYKARLHRLEVQYKRRAKNKKSAKVLEVIGETIKDHESQKEQSVPVLPESNDPGEGRGALPG